MQGQARTLPAGLVGEIRRSIAGARVEIDHHHQDVEFDLVVRGTGHYTLGDITYVLRPGTLVWLLPGQRHHLTRSPRLEMWVVLARPDLLDQARLAELAAQPSRMLLGQEVLDLDRILSQVAQDSDEPAVYNAGIAYLLMRAWRAGRHRPAAEVRAMHPAVARALLIMRETGAEDSLSEVADKAGITPSYLSRLLLEHSGRSFIDWRNRIRLDRFIEGYRPGSNLLEAALSAGFGSYARFHHIFTQALGCPPSDWVKQAQEDRGNQKPRPAAEGHVELGLPPAGSLDARQRWARLVAAIGPAVPALLGPRFLDRLLASDGSRPAAADPLVLDASFTAQQQAKLLGPLRHQAPTVAGELEHLFALHDFPGLYAGLLGAFGLSPERLAHAVAALALVLWVAANREHDPAVGPVQSVARQVDAALQAQPSKGDLNALQAAHTALLCQFVVTYHALQAARASSDPRLIDELAVAASVCGETAFGGTLADIELTFTGFGPRTGNKAGPRTGSLGSLQAAGTRP